MMKAWFNTSSNIRHVNACLFTDCKNMWHNSAEKYILASIGGMVFMSSSFFASLAGS